MSAASKTKDPRDADPYRSLEEDNELTRAWLHAQARNAADYFNDIPLREQLDKELSKLYCFDEMIGVPVPRKGKYFSEIHRAGQKKNIVCVQTGISGPVRTLIDPNTFRHDEPGTITDWRPSPDGRLLAYSISKGGNEKNDIRIMDVASGENLSDMIPDEGYPVFQAWDQNHLGFWYVQRDPTIPLLGVASEARIFWRRVYYHTLGTDYRNDQFVNTTTNEKDWLTINVSPDGRHLLVHMGGYDKEDGRRWDELYLRDLTDTRGNFVLVVERCPGACRHYYMHRGMLYLLTDEGAPRKQVLQLDIEDALKKGGVPHVCIPEAKGTLERIALVADKLFTVHLEKDLHSVMRQYDLRGNFVREVWLPTPGSVGALSYENEGAELFFSFEWFTVPPSVYRIDFRAFWAGVTLFARAEAGFNTATLATKHVWYPSKDGTRVPMYLIYKKGLAPDGNVPTVLYGYGGFDEIVKPRFRRSIIPFLTRGGLFAVANLRGGGEFGREWHEAGMRKNKQNVFDDFAAAIRWLIGKGYTCPEKVIIEGGSNGGLLTMVTITQNPGLVAGAIARAPLTDMLRYHLFFGGTRWVPEYGHPDDPDMRRCLLAYSPYHNVRDGKRYPAVLISTAKGDDWVHPMHSYKMIARLQEANVSASPILLRIADGGHTYATSMPGEDLLLDELLFVLRVLGMTDTALFRWRAFISKLRRKILRS